MSLATKCGVCYSFGMTGIMGLMIFMSTLSIGCVFVSAVVLVIPWKLLLSICSLYPFGVFVMLLSIFAFMFQNKPAMSAGGGHYVWQSCFRLLLNNQTYFSEFRYYCLWS